MESKETKDAFSYAGFQHLINGILSVITLLQLIYHNDLKKRCLIRVYAVFTNFAKRYRCVISRLIVFEENKCVGVNVTELVHMSRVLNK